MKQRIVKFAAALLAALCLLALLPVQASAIHMNIRVAVKGKCPPITSGTAIPLWA